MKKFIESKRVVVGLCAVLVAVSAFFYAPIEVKAEEKSSGVVSSGVVTSGGLKGFDLSVQNVGVSLIDSVSDDLVYEVNYTVNGILNLSSGAYLRDITLSLGSNVLYSAQYIADDGYNYTGLHQFSYTNTGYFLGSDLKNKDLSFVCVLYSPYTDVDSINYSTSFDLVCNSYEIVSSSDSDDYKNGYNDGYQQGQTDGYNNGYSQGFVNGEESGFQAGKDSVDTQSYYNSGFSAGYDEGFSDGYSTGYNKGYEDGRNVNGSISSPKYLTGYASELVSGNDFYVGSNSIADVEHFIVGSEIETLRWFDTQLGTVHVDTDINYRIPIASTHGSSVYVEGDGIHQVFHLNLTPYLVHDSISGTLLKDCSISEVYVVYQGNKYYATLSYGSDDSVTAFFDFYAPLEIGHTILSNTSHDVHVKMQCSALLANDSGVNGHMYTGVFVTPKIQFVCRVSDFYYNVFYSDDISGSIIQDQTDEITGSLDEQKEIQQGQLEEQKEQTETQKGIAASIKEFFGSFFDNLINSIIHVIVPTKEEMGELFNRLNDFFSETFGFLYYPFEFIINAFNIFLVSDSGTGLTLPAFSIMGYEVWGNQTYDIASEPIVGEIFGFVRMGTGAMLVMWFVNFLKDFFDKRFGGGGN